MSLEHLQFITGLFSGSGGPSKWQHGVFNQLQRELRYGPPKEIMRGLSRAGRRSQSTIADVMSQGGRLGSGAHVGALAGVESDVLDTKAKVTFGHRQNLLSNLVAMASVMTEQKSAAQAAGDFVSDTWKRWWS